MNGKTTPDDEDPLPRHVQVGFGNRTPSPMTPHHAAKRLATGKNPTVTTRRWRVHWAWVPAAIFVTVIGWSRYGWWLILLVTVGLAVGVYGEWAARRKRGT